MQQSLWEDETLSVWELHHHLGAVLANIPRVEASPPLYFILGWGWTRLFGLDAAGLRSLSALLGIAIVPVVYMTARELCTRRAAVIAGALAAFSPALVWYSQEARPFALAYLLCALSFLFFARILALARPDPAAAAAAGGGSCASAPAEAEAKLRRTCMLWAATSALAMVTHYFTWFLVLVEAIWLLVATRKTTDGLRNLAGRLNRSVVIACSALMGLVVCLAPLAIYQRVAGGGSDLGFIGEFPRADRLKEAGTEAFLGAARPHVGLIVRLVEVLLVAVLVALWLRGAPGQRRAARLCLATATLAVALPVLADFVGAKYIDGRYLLVALPALLVGLGIALAATRPRWLGAAVASLLCASSLIVVWDVVEHPWVQRQDWRDAAKALGPAPVDRAIIITPALTNPPPAPRLIALAAVYLKSVRGMPATGRPVSEIDLLEVGGAPEYPDRPNPRPPLPGFRMIEHKGNGNFELFRFTSPKPVLAAPNQLNGEQLLPDYTSVGLQKASNHDASARTAAQANVDQPDGTRGHPVGAPECSGTSLGAPVGTYRSHFERQGLPCRRSASQWRERSPTPRA